MGMHAPLPHPFMVIATQNPVEYQGTYPLPEAQLDRFAIQLELGYPSPDVEVDVLFDQCRPASRSRAWPVRYGQRGDIDSSCRTAVRQVRVEKVVAA